MLRKMLYPKVETLLNTIALKLSERGITPNQLTVAGTAVCFLTAWIYASGLFFLGAIFLLLASLGDLLDGPLARTTKATSKFGAFLDSTLDRYSDFFIFGGIATAYAWQAEPGLFLLTLGALAGAFVTSYAKARAENFVQDCGVGFFGRAERILILAVGSLIGPLMPYCLWVLLIGTNATAIHRILHTQKLLAKTDLQTDSTQS